MLNSRLVMGLGARRLLLLALLALTGMALLHSSSRLSWGETIWTFIVLQALTMACFGLVGANAGSLAMAPVGHIAGTASSLQGMVTTIGGALIGMVVGQAFDGTTLPLIIGFVACGALATLGRALGQSAPDRDAGNGAGAPGLKPDAPAEVPNGRSHHGPCNPTDVVLRFRARHQRLGDLIGMAADRALEPGRRPRDCP